MQFFSARLLPKVKPLLLTLALGLGGTEAALAQSFCGTPSSPDPLRGNAATSYTTASCYTVRVYFHIVRASNGSGGQNVSVLPQVMNRLAAVYAPYSVYFQNTGSDEIRNDTYVSNFSINDAAKYNALINTNVVGNAINIYLLDDNSSFGGGKAAGNPSTALVLGGTFYKAGVAQPLVNSPIIAHEMGHSLGLYHTFETYFGAELANGANCQSRGDLVCDTPAESPAYNFTDDASCRFPTQFRDPNGTLQNPDVGNVMDYITPSCMTHFTTGQGNRVLATLASSSVLTNVISAAPAPPVFTVSPALPAALCLNASQSFDVYVNNNQGATGYTWSLFPNDANATIVSGNGTAHVVVRFAPGNYTKTLSVVANYTCGTSSPIAQSISVHTGGVPSTPPDFGLIQTAAGSSNSSPEYALRVNNGNETDYFTVEMYGPNSAMRVNVDLNDPYGFTTLATSLRGPTSFNVTVVRYNSCGAGASATKVITVPGPGNPGTPGTPGGPGGEEPYATKPKEASADETRVAATGQLTAYPNPANASLAIPVAKEAVGGAVQLVDNLGRVVQQIPVTSEQVLHLDTHELANGLYHLILPGSPGKGQTIQIKH